MDSFSANQIKQFFGTHYEILPFVDPIKKSTEYYYVVENPFSAEEGIENKFDNKGEVILKATSKNKELLETKSKNGSIYDTEIAKLEKKLKKLFLSKEEKAILKESLNNMLTLKEEFHKNLEYLQNIDITVNEITEQNKPIFNDELLKIGDNLFLISQKTNNIQFFSSKINKIIYSKKDNVFIYALDNNIRIIQQPNSSAIYDEHSEYKVFSNTNDFKEEGQKIIEKIENSFNKALDNVA